MNETTKRRLVGAAVLVALGILLPFGLIKWLEGPDPGRDADVRIYEITPDGEARPIADAQPAAPDGGRERASPTPRGGPGPDREPETASGPAPESGAEPEPASEPEPEPEPEPAASPAPAREPAVPPAEDETAGPSWAVQVGSFRSEDNARELMNELAADFPAFYSEGEVEGVTYYRVRVGPYPSEAQAERAAAALAKRGRKGQIRREP